MIATTVRRIRIPSETPRRLTPPRLPRWTWWLAVGLATIVIVGHGCHSGDHDDELSIQMPHQASQERE